MINTNYSIVTHRVTGSIGKQVSCFGDAVSRRAKLIIDMTSFIPLETRNVPLKQSSHHT